MSDSASDSAVDDGGGATVFTPAANAAAVVGTVTPGAVDGVPDGLTQIDDEDVPLAVVEDEDDNTGRELVGVEDEDVPLANPAVDRIWWSWIPIIAPIASVIDSYRKDKKESDRKKED